jgi:hypothetical protein
MNHENIILPEDVADFVSEKKISAIFGLYVSSACGWFTKATDIELTVCGLNDDETVIAILISSDYTREEFNLLRKQFYKIYPSSEYEYFSILRA